MIEQKNKKSQMINWISIQKELPIGKKEILITNGDSVVSALWKNGEYLLCFEDIDQEWSPNKITHWSEFNFPQKDLIKKLEFLDSLSSEEEIR